MMRAFPSQGLSACVRLLFICAATIFCASAALAQSQANAADLQGYVRDPNGAIVVGATVTARNPATNFSRDATTNDDGYYHMVSLPPGEYEVTVEAATYKKAVVPSYKLTVGARADLDITLEVGQVNEIVNISVEDQPVVETSRTAIANTIEQQRIENLPINERSATGFALTISTVGRDNGRPIGPAQKRRCAARPWAWRHAGRCSGSSARAPAEPLLDPGLPSTPPVLSCWAACRAIAGTPSPQRSRCQPTRRC